MIDETGASPDRQKLIGEIQQRDKAVFDEWAKGDVFRKLPSTADQLRYLIPPRLWDFVSDPSRINVALLDKNGKYLEFIIFEETDETLTNMDSLEDFRELVDSHHKDITFPSDVDPFHWERQDYLDEGIIGVTDKIYLNIALEPIEDELFVVSHGDRKELRGKGIASSLYERLTEIAGKLGFKYITGENYKNNVGFFLENLGRTSFDKLPPDLKDHFESHHGGEDFFEEFFTIGFVNPEDKPGAKSG